MIEKYKALRGKEQHRTFSSRTIKTELAIATAIIAAITVMLVVVL